MNIGLDDLVQNLTATHVVRRWRAGRREAGRRRVRRWKAWGIHGENKTTNAGYNSRQ